MTQRNGFFKKNKLLDIFIYIFLSVVIIFGVIDLINKKFSLELFSNKEYEFISPLFNNEGFDLIEQTKRAFYKNDLEALVSWYLQNTWIKTISLYFRDLNNWYVFWINERELFTPASLAKVPTLFYILKKSENVFWFLDQQVRIDWNYDYPLNYPPSSKIISWAVYSIRDLLSYMIKYSDNNATLILRQMMLGDGYKKLYDDLKISFSWDGTVEVVDYSALYRILFNASYLKKSSSEYALKLLSETDFNEWLTKYLPWTIKVSHKFGEFSLDGEIRQLHDCGIVYYPNHPYVLCVMTRGSNYKYLEKTISQLSKYVFEKIDSTYLELKNSQ